MNDRNPYQSLPDISTLDVCKDVLSLKMAPSCPNMMQLYDCKGFVIDDDDYVAILMEFIHGENGRDFIEKPSLTMDVATAVSIFKGIINGMKCLHDKLYYDFDFKAPNFMVDECTLTPKIIDVDAAISSEVIDQELANKAQIAYPVSMPYVPIEKTLFLDFETKGNPKFLIYNYAFDKETDKKAFMTKWDNFQIGKTICIWIKKLNNVVGKPSAIKKAANCEKYVPQPVVPTSSD